MKRSRPLLALALVSPALLFNGCVGYDTTMFVTKSNFGVDLDTKPPTAEISVARREGVIAPSFEQGQTPPVMASFKVQHNGLVTFFTGMGQTFAGGDSAVALSTLYDDATPLSKEEAAPHFDSTLELSEAPTYKVLWFFKRQMPPSSRIRPFVFGTDTSLGLKVAWSGLTAQVPDTVRLGFNRKEFALAPVNLQTNDDRSRVKMPSFLATVDANAAVYAPEKSGLRSLQYFATGDAATQLAMEQNVRKAMLYDANPTVDEKARAFDSVFSGRDAASFQAGVVMVQIYEGLRQLQENGDAQAGAYVSALDALGALVPQEDSYTGYSFGVEQQEGVVVGVRVLQKPADDFFSDGQTTFATFQAYLTYLKTSITALENSLAEEEFLLQKADDSVVQVLKNDAVWQELSAESARFQDRQKALAQAAADEPAAAAAVSYYASTLAQ